MRACLLIIVNLTYLYLVSCFSRRTEINDALDSGATVKPRFVKASIYTEFTDFSRKEIKDFESKFNT